MRYPIDKYNIVIHQHPRYAGVEIIAWSTYAGKPVHGKAICRVDDNYNEELGKRLAMARCAAKIARKRLKRATQMCDKANEQVKTAMGHLNDMEHYYQDARKEVQTCDELISELLERM